MMDDWTDDWVVTYCFATKIGRVDHWFAWYPVRLWYGRIVWLCRVRRLRFVKKQHLHGPFWWFWSYDNGGQLMEIRTPPVVVIDKNGDEHATFGPDHSIADICRWLMQNRSEAEEAAYVLAEMLAGTYGFKRQ